MRDHAREDQVTSAAILFTIALYPAGLATPGMIAILIGLVWRTIGRGWRLSSTAIDLPLAALALAITASALASPWRAEALTTVAYFMLTLLVSVVPVVAYVKAGPERALGILMLWTAGGVVAALWGLTQSWANCFAVLPTVAMGPTANGLGTTLASASVLALGLFAGGKMEGRPLWIAGIPVVLAGLFATMSRAAWVGLAAGILVLAIVDSGARMRLALVVAWAFVVAMGSIIALPNLCTGRAAPLRGEGPPLRPIFAEVRSIGDLQENRNRLVLWRTAVRMFTDQPVLGTGFGTFTLAFKRYRPPDSPDEEPPTAHNIFLNFAAETGVLGLAAFVGLCAAGLLSTWRWLIRSPPQSSGRVAAAAVLAGIVTFVVNQLFEGTVLTVHAGFGFLALFALGAAGERYLAPAPAPCTSTYQAGAATSGN